MTAPAQQTKPIIHLRARTGNVVGGTQLISYCGVRELETYQSRRRMSKSLKAVTCAACLVRVKPRYGRNYTNPDVILYVGGVPVADTTAKKNKG